VNNEGAILVIRIMRGQVYQTIAAGPDDIAHVLRHAEPGRYVVEEVSAAGKFLASGHSCRRWGSAIRHPDGQVTLDPDPWPA
jgi:hypothetical protein